jgi:hypothetical protein
MKYVITESQYKRLINEDKFMRLTSASDTLGEIINNLDSIDCNDQKSYYKHNFVRVYCDQLQGKPVEDLIKIKDLMDKEIASMIHDEFSDKIMNRF